MIVLLIDPFYVNSDHIFPKDKISVIQLFLFFHIQQAFKELLVHV